METVMPAVQWLWAEALDLLFPPRCVGCGEDGVYLCGRCMGVLVRLDTPVCPGCARPLNEMGVCGPCAGYPLRIEGIVAAFQMRGVAREMVHGLKYGNLRVLSPLMASLMVESLEGAPFDVIVPVPLHPRRERNRGYNQAELLARGIAAEVGVYCESNCLARMRNTPAQVGLEGMEARRSNVANAFQARRRFDGQSVLVVDDVCTTGATLEACGLALKAAGAIAVRGIVFAR